MVQIGLAVRTMFRDLGRSAKAGVDKARLDMRSPSDGMALDIGPFRIEVTGPLRLADFIGCF
jgi:hypothetical protein